ncbi:hypothetical protein BYT27DRAFT_7199996 [Phlegmacium glaucopus]|nr:hypothetical protein BYT27DRAFT_7199996 [Phlegmacium glaucopus]
MTETLRDKRVEQAVHDAVRIEQLESIVALIRDRPFSVLTLSHWVFGRCTRVDYVKGPSPLESKPARTSL